MSRFALRLKRPIKLSMGSFKMRKIDMRGSSELYGSWKTNCILRRSAFMSFMFVTSAPSKTIRPAVGSIRRNKVRPVVVLPQPDSPTSPRFCPRPSSKETPSTALTTGPLEDRDRRPKGKYFLSPSTVSKGSDVERRLCASIFTMAYSPASIANCGPDRSL